MGQAPTGPNFLDYQKPDTRINILVRRLRLTAAIVGIVALSCGLCLLLAPVILDDDKFGAGIVGTPLSAPATFHNGILYLINTVVLIAWLVLLQLLFLMPRGKLRFQLSVEGRPLKRAAMAGGFIAMLISGGLIAVAMEPPAWWDQLLYRGEDGFPGLYWIWGSMAFLWVLWAIVFYLYGRNLDRYTWMTRIVRGLVAGSVLEMFVAGPAFAFSPLGRSSENCYCTRGSYTGLIFGIIAILWLFGPGVFLLYAREKRRLERATPSATSP